MKRLLTLDAGAIGDAIEGLKDDRNPHVVALVELGREWLAEWELRDRGDAHLPDMAKVGLAFCLASIDASTEAEDAHLAEAVVFAETHLRQDIRKVRQAIARRFAKKDHLTTGDNDDPHRH